MADKKTPRRIKKQPETVRQRTERKTTEPAKKRRLQQAAGSAKKPLAAASKAAKKEFHPIKLPNNKIGRLLNKRARFMPKYFSNSWAEIRQVEWPNARETAKLTTAVLLFALVLGGLIWGLDYGLNKLFREILLG